VNLITEQYALFDEIRDIDTLVITAGFGRVAAFDALTEPEITSIIKCNELAVIRIIKNYYDRINSDEDFFCAVMGSIAGHVSFRVFRIRRIKAGVSSFAESLNAELRARAGPTEFWRSLPAPGRTRFEGGKNDIRKHLGLADEIVERMLGRKTLFIPGMKRSIKAYWTATDRTPRGSGPKATS
jgi:short-subunit dehydrogenase